MLSLSTHLFVYYRLNGEIFSTISQYGFNFVEIWGTLPHFPYNDKNFLNDFENYLEKNSLNVASFHAPFYLKLKDKKPDEILSLSSCDPSVRRKTVDELKKFLDSIASISHVIEPVPVVIHSGFTGEKEKFECHLEKFYESVSELLKEMPGRKNILSLENATSGFDPPEWVVEFVSQFSSPYLRVCLDIGHANVTTHGWVKQLSQYIDMVKDFHVHDNHGKDDEHLPPGDGNIDFEKFFEFVSPSHLLTLELMDYSKGEDLKLALEALRRSIKFLAGRGLWRQHIRK